MRLLFNVGLIALSASLARATEGQTRSFVYEVHVPKTARPCVEEARLLGEKFSQRGVVVTDAACNGVVKVPGAAGQDGYALAVSYTAVSELSIYSAVVSAPDEETSSSPGMHYGIYESYDPCLKDAEAQERAYEAETGLSVLAFSCEPDQTFGNTFILKIDGIGSPKLQLFAFEPFKEGADAAQTHEASVLLSNLGAQSVQTTGSVVLYYAAAPLHVKSQVVGLFSSQNECQVQLSDVKAALDASGASSSAIQCVQNPSGATFSARVIQDSFYWMSDEPAFGAPSYYSFEECMQDKARYLAAYSSPLGHVVGGLCTLSFDGAASELYSISVLTTP